MEPEAYAELDQLEGSHWWYAGMRRITEGLIRRHVYENQPLTIVDAGCGTGHNLEALSIFGTTTGFDYSMLALQYASKKHSGKLTRASVENIPYPSESFDLLTSFDVIYAWEVGDDVQALREFARVLRPGGHLVIRLPALPALKGHHDHIVHTARRYTKEDLSQKLEQVGLIVERTTYANSLLMPPVFVMRKLQLLLAKPHPGQPSDVQPTPEPFNTILQWLLTLEARWIESGRNFPLGVSLFAVASKPQ